jgi:cell division protein FtsL
MVRVMNFFCFALSALACLALYHISEQTRVARVQLSAVEHQIADEKDSMSVLQAEWARAADPSRIQQLAQSHLGLNDAPAVELSSLELLPRRGDAPLADAPVRNASVTAPLKPHDDRIRLASIHIGN